MHMQCNARRCKIIGNNCAESPALYSKASINSIAVGPVLQLLLPLHCLEGSWRIQLPHELGVIKELSCHPSSPLLVLLLLSLTSLFLFLKLQKLLLTAKPFQLSLHRSETLFLLLTTTSPLFLSPFGRCLLVPDCPPLSLLPGLLLLLKLPLTGRSSNDGVALLICKGNMAGGGVGNRARGRLASCSRYEKHQEIIKRAI